MKKAIKLKKEFKLNKILITVLVFGILGSIAIIISNAAAPSVPAGYKELFIDDFSSNILDTSKWNIATGTEGHSQSNYTTNNVYISNGNLNIRTRRHCVAAITEALNDTNVSVAPCTAGKITMYSSGQVRTGNIFPSAGKIEIRAKIPAAQNGLWPALWFRNQSAWCTSNYGELDIMEWYGERPRNNTSTSHFSCANNSTKMLQHNIDTGSDMSSAFHTWAMEWDSDKVVYYYDGNIVPHSNSQGDSDKNNVTFTDFNGLTSSQFSNIMNQLWQLRINTQVIKEGDAWHPAPDNNQNFNSVEFQIDYVRVLIKDTTAPPPPTTSFQCPTYKFSKSTPAVGVAESSGLIESRKQPGIFWMHNDSGGTNEIFAVNSSGKILSRHALSGATNNDWEDISFGPGPDSSKDYIYVGDVGTKGRANYKIYRVPEPTVDSSWTNVAQTISSASVETFNIAYKLKSGASKSPDVEGFSVDPITKDIYIFDKEINNRTITGVNGTSFVFKINGTSLSTATTNTANEIANVISNVDSQTTNAYPPGFVGSDISADGKLMIAKNYDELFIWHKGDSNSFDQVLNAKSDGSSTCFYQDSNITGSTIPGSESVSFSPTSQFISFISEGTGAPITTFENTSYTAGGSSGTSQFTIVASGDVGKAADKTRQQRTADIIKRINPTYVLALGDLAYESGTDAEFAANYAPYWGVPEIFNITKPIPGNHEYNTLGATGYFNYFDPGNTGKFGPRDKGYYSFTKDNWLFLNINSECSKIGGCRNDSVQAKWVDQQLSANPDKCVVASWHRPRVTNGRHLDYTEMNDIWNKIVARKGLVLSAHNHLYTRTVPLGLNAQPDPNGIIQFISGAGGATFYTDAYTDSRDAKKILSTLGVLKLNLSGNKVQYEFVDTNNVVLDQGSQTLGCPDPSSQTSKTGDLNKDNKIDILDLSILLSNWDPAASKPKSIADINNDNKVDVLDLSTLLSNWGK